MQPDTACQDHPRSRGVYPIDSPTSELARGSSPLARGLLTLNHPQAHPDGIIPARAGFTHSRFLGTSASSDHPRSRGVYDVPANATFTAVGSSPLARGLRPSPGGDSHRARIIPARAGFTTIADLVIEATEGSSPLARGLHSIVFTPVSSTRIIPARAGFTCSAAVSNGCG